MIGRVLSSLAALSILVGFFLPWGGEAAGYRWAASHPETLDALLGAMQFLVALVALGVSLAGATPPLFGIPAAALLSVLALRTLFGFGLPGADIVAMTAWRDILRPGPGFLLMQGGSVLLAITGNRGHPYLGRLFQRIDEIVFQIEKGLLTVALGLMVLLVFLDLVLRETVSSGIPAAQRVALYLMLWVGFLGASLATRGGKHLSMDLLEKLLPDEARRYWQTAVLLGSSAFCFFLARVGALFVLQNRSYGDPPLYYGIPEWGVQSVIPFSFFVMGGRFLAKARHAWRREREPKERGKRLGHGREKGEEGR